MEYGIKVRSFGVAAERGGGRIRPPSRPTPSEPHSDAASGSSSLALAFRVFLVPRAEARYLLTLLTKGGSVAKSLANWSSSSPVMVEAFGFLAAGGPRNKGLSCNGACPAPGIGGDGLLRSEKGERRGELRDVAIITRSSYAFSGDGGLSAWLTLPRFLM